MDAPFSYNPFMLEPYRRDAVAKSLSRFSEIIWGALFISVLFSSLHLLLKLAIVAIAVLFFISAWFICPPKSPKEV